MNCDFDDSWSLGYYSDVSHSSPDLPINTEAYIKFIEEPGDYRYRYRKEKYHGFIVGVNSPATKKKDLCIFPKVKLFNCNRNAIVRVWLLSTDLLGEPKAHFHQLARKPPKGALKLEPHDFLANEQNNYEVTLDYLHIIHAVSSEVKDINIYRKKKAHIDSGQYEIPQKTPSPNKDEKEEIKQIDKNQSVLYIQVFDEKMHFKICFSVSRRKIKNLHNAETAVLKIVNCSRTFGTCHGDDEVFIFVEKISKGVEVRFFKLGEDKKRIWEAPATFGPHNVHHQLGIVFRTPKYPMEIKCDTKVFFELHRKNDGACSEPIAFTYKPHQDYKRYDTSMKRPHSPELMSSEVELPSVVTSYKGKRLKDEFTYPDSTTTALNTIQDNFEYEVLQLIPEYPIQPNDDELLGNPDILYPLAEWPTDIDTVFDFDGVSSSNDLVPDNENLINLKRSGIPCEEGQMAGIVELSTTNGPDNSSSGTHATVESTKDLKRVANKLLHTMKLNLHSAISQRKSIQEINKMLNHVENVNSVDYEGNSALHYSAELPEYLKILLSRKDIDRNIRNLWGDNVTLSAARNGYVAAMKLLLDENFDPNVQNSRSGETPLHIAISHQNLPMVNLLLKHGADPLKDNFSGCSSYEYSLNCEPDINHIMYIWMQKSMFKEKSITRSAQPACSVVEHELVGKLEELAVSAQ